MEVQPLMPLRLCRNVKVAATGPIPVRRLASRSQFGFKLHQMSPRSVGWTATLGSTAPCNLECLFGTSSSTRHLTRLCQIPLSSQCVTLQCAALEIAETNHLWIETIRGQIASSLEHGASPLAVLSQFAKH